MDTCTSRRGFLVLSSCGAPALRPCAACGAMTCPEHLSPSSGLSECLACANSKPKPTKGETDTDTDSDDSSSGATTSSSTYDSDASYRYRQSYYRESNYDPSPSSFDRSDSRAFVAGSAAAVALDDDEAGGASFGDS